MTLLEAHKLALKVLKQVMEEKLDENNVQLAQVSCKYQAVLIPGYISRRIRDSVRGEIEGGHRGYCRVESKVEVDVYIHDAKRCSFVDARNKAGFSFSFLPR